MNYTKPQITSPASASSVIQGTSPKPVMTYIDSQGSVDYKTVAAYESDE
jgi:hypothetical protein